MADNEFLTAQVTIRANIERLKVDLAAAKREVYRTVDELSARAAKGDVDKLAKRSALITQRGVKDQIKAENDLLRGLRQREVQNNKIAREHRRAVNEMIDDLKRFSRQSFIVGAGITAAMTYTVKKYAEAEKAMRVAVATTDTGPSEEMFKKLYMAAEESAIRFNVSVQEISKAFDVLKVSGYSAEQQIAILPTLVALAKGTVTDTGIVADKILDLMDAFSISINNLDSVSNQLAYSATHSRTSLNDLMDGLMSIGNIAKMTSNDFQDMAAAVMIMTNAGVKGSQATMALRRIMIDLMDKSSKGAQALEDYMDIYAHFEDGTKAIKPFKQIIDELSIALKKVDPQIRDSLLVEWFGQRAVAGGMAIFKGGSAQIEEFAEAMRNSGTAVQNLVDNQLKALWEQLGILYQQLQAVVKAIGQGLAPAIEKINNVLRPYLKALREWMDLNPQIVSGISEWIAGLGIGLVVLGSLGLAIQGVNIMLAPFINGIKLAGGAMLATFGTWPAIILRVVTALYIFRAILNSTDNGVATTSYKLKEFQSSLYHTMSIITKLSHLSPVVAGITLYKAAKGDVADSPMAQAIRWQQESEKLHAEALDLANKAAGGFDPKNPNAPIGTEAAGEVAGVWAMVKAQFSKDLDGFIGMLSSKFPQFTGLLEKYRTEMIKGIGAGSPFGKGDDKGSEVQFKNWQLGIQKYYAEIRNWNSFVQDSVKQTAHNFESALGDAFAKVGYEANTLKEIINDLITSIDQEIRRFMGQLTARAIMKGTVEVLFPNLAGVLDPSATQLQSAGVTLQVAGTSQITAASGLQLAGMQLSAAAGALGASGGMSIMGGMGGMAGGLVGSGGSFGNAGGSDMTVPGNYAHGGGIVGGNLTPNILMPTSLFTNAPRLHDGLKLKADEFPAILQKGEEVIPKEGRSERGSGRAIYINVSSIDAAGTYQFLSRNKKQIASMVQDSISTNHSLRRSDKQWK